MIERSTIPPRITPTPMPSLALELSPDVAVFIEAVDITNVLVLEVKDVELRVVVEVLG